MDQCFTKGVTYVNNRHVFHTLCNEFTSAWSMFVYNIIDLNDIKF